MLIKLLRYFLILAFFLYFSIGFCQAQALSTGSASQNTIFEKATSGITLKINGKDYELSGKEISQWIEEETDLAFSPGYFSEMENGNFCRYKKSVVCKLLFNPKMENKIKKSSRLDLNEDLIEKYIQNLAKTVDEESEDAKFKIEGGKVSAFSLNKKGGELNQEKSLEIIVNYLKSNDTSSHLELPYKIIDPQVAIDSIDNMGITSLIGEGKSNFRGSPKNRVFNIKVAAEKFNGVLIKPGQEFSFVKVLGEVDGEHGYLPELVIKKDKTEPEFGGGICQVSTTAFRAAVYSGLEITARRNHAYPVSYYNPQGMDATVYVPRPDLKFKNNTPGYILIQVKIEGTELIFDFYGTDDGRKTDVIGPKITERNSDGSMKTTFTQEVYDKDGNLVRKDVFKSSYDSPSKYPHPGTTSDVLTQKPNSWSDREWKEYKNAHGI